MAKSLDTEKSQDFRRTPQLVSMFSRLNLVKAAGSRQLLNLEPPGSWCFTNLRQLNEMSSFCGADTSEGFEIGTLAQSLPSLCHQTRNSHRMSSASGWLWMLQRSKCLTNAGELSGPESSQAYGQQRPSGAHNHITGQRVWQVSARYLAPGVSPELAV